LRLDVLDRFSGRLRLLWAEGVRHNKGGLLTTKLFIALRELPLTAAGKVDKKRLAEVMHDRKPT